MPFHKLWNILLKSCMPEAIISALELLLQSMELGWIFLIRYNNVLFTLTIICKDVRILCVVETCRQSKYKHVDYILGSSPKAGASESQFDVVESVSYLIVDKPFLNLSWF